MNQRAVNLKLPGLVMLATVLLWAAWHFVFVYKANETTSQLAANPQSVPIEPQIHVGVSTPAAEHGETHVDAPSARQPTSSLAQKSTASLPNQPHADSLASDTDDQNTELEAPALPVEIEQVIEAEKLLQEAQLLDKCVSLPRDRDLQIAMIDSVRADQSRSEDELVATFKACENTPIRSREDATAAFEEAAEAGSAEAQFQLAARFPLGSDENLQWNHAAAINDHVDAQLTLARIHLDKKTETDNQIAYRWLRNAQRNGSALSQFYLESLEKELSVSAWQSMEGPAN